jgi:phosphonate transport system permease protein
MLTIEQQLLAKPRNRFYIVIISGIVTLLFLWSVSTIDVNAMNRSAWEIAWNIIKGIFTPDLTLLFNFTTNGIFYLLIETIAIAFLGTLIGAFIAVPMAFLSASNVVPKPIAYVTRLLLIFIRTIPELVYGLLFLRVTGPGAFAGVLTIAIASIGMLSKLYVDAIENLDTKVLEAMTSLGCSTFEKIRFGIIPQLFSIFLSIIVYRFDMNLRDASILGMVGAGGIGAPLKFAMDSNRWSQVGSILIGLVVLILLTELFSNKVRSKLVRG